MTIDLNLTIEEFVKEKAATTTDNTDTIIEDLKISVRDLIILHGSSFTLCTNI